MKKVLLLIIFSFMFCGGSALALGTNSVYEEPLREVFIKYKQHAWSTYEFYVVTNLNSGNYLKYQWDIDRKETFNAERLKYDFSKGNHLVTVRVEDKYGNVKSDSLKMDINFWSLQNNWIWWCLYLFVVILIIYYWIAKVYYLVNRRFISKQARYFLDILDEHGWVERIIENHMKKSKVVTNPSLPAYAVRPRRRTGSSQKQK